MSGIRNVANLTGVLAAIEVNRILLTVIQATVADTNSDLELVDGNVDAIRAKTDAMGVLTETGGTITTDGTEQNVYINNAPMGVFEPRVFRMNFVNHTVTESVTIRTYYRTVDGGAWVQDGSLPIVGVPVNSLVSVTLDPARWGVRVTIEKTAGTNRDYPWEVFFEV